MKIVSIFILSLNFLEAMANSDNIADSLEVRTNLEIYNLFIYLSSGFIKFLKNRISETFTFHRINPNKLFVYFSV